MEARTAGDQGTRGVVYIFHSLEHKFQPDEAVPVVRGRRHPPLLGPEEIRPGQVRFHLPAGGSHRGEKKDWKVS